MTTALEKVRTGQSFRPKADTWNAFVHAAQYVRDREIGGGARIGDLARGETVTIKNSSGADRARFNVLAVSDILIDPDANESEFIRTMALDCDLVENVAGENALLYVILQEPIVGDGLGQALLDGITPCKVYVHNEDHQYALPGVDPGYLDSAAAGIAKILWKGAGTGEQWALVRIPAEDGQSIRLYNASGGILSDGYVCGIDGMETGGPPFAFRAIKPTSDHQINILPMGGPDLENDAGRWVPLGPVMRYRLRGRITVAPGESVGAAAGSHLLELGNLGYIILGEEIVSVDERYVYVVHGDGATPTGTGTITNPETPSATTEPATGSATEGTGSETEPEGTESDTGTGTEGTGTDTETGSEGTPWEETDTEPGTDTDTGTGTEGTGTDTETGTDTSGTGTDTTGTASDTETLTPSAGGNGCNDCNPAIPDKLYVTLSGLGGDFATDIGDGKHTVAHHAGCDWYESTDPSVPAVPYIHLWWDTDHWYVQIVVGVNCTLKWQGPADECEPWDGSYAWHTCTDITCSGSCAASSGASCSVSWN